MNGIERILQRIESEARAEREEILNNARKEAAVIESRYQAQAEQETAELEAKRQRAAVEQEERLLSVAQMEARKTLLAVKQELVEQAYSQALEKLCSLSEAERVSVLAELLARASSNGREEVIVSPGDHDGAGRAAVEKANADAGLQLTLSEETRPIRGGFILRDGSIEMNCAFDTLIRLQKTETAGMVAKKLFG